MATQPWPHSPPPLHHSFFNFTTLPRPSPMFELTTFSLSAHWCCQQIRGPETNLLTPHKPCGLIVKYPVTQLSGLGKNVETIVLCTSGGFERGDRVSTIVWYHCAPTGKPRRHLVNVKQLYLFQKYIYYYLLYLFSS